MLSGSDCTLPILIHTRMTSGIGGYEARPPEFLAKPELFQMLRVIVNLRKVGTNRLLTVQVAAQISNSSDLLHVCLFYHLQAPDEEHRRLQQTFLGHQCFQYIRDRFKMFSAIHNNFVWEVYHVGVSDWTHIWSSSRIISSNVCPRDQSWTKSARLLPKDSFAS